MATNLVQYFVLYGQCLLSISNKSNAILPPVSSAELLSSTTTSLLHNNSGELFVEIRVDQIIVQTKEARTRNGALSWDDEVLLYVC
jgi:hypothetical protein